MDTNNIKNSQTYEFPPSPYGTYFELKTNHFQLEEATRSGSFDMKYRHYHSTYEIYYLLEGSRYYFIDRNSFFVQPGSLVFIGKNRIHKTSPAEQHFHHRFLIEIEYLLREMLLFSFRIKSKNNATRISSATFQGAETEKIRTVNESKRLKNFCAQAYFPLQRLHS